MSLIKGNIGTGILSMPVVLRYAGLWVNSYLYFSYFQDWIYYDYSIRDFVNLLNACSFENCQCSSAKVCVHESHLFILESYRHNWDRSKMDYAETAFLVLKYGPERLRKPKGKLKYVFDL